MTRPGYRKTSPARVFVDFSREAVEALSENNFILYEDPLDLKNTLKSFTYTLTKGDVPGRMDLELINPSQKVEEKLFSWFASVNPRSWRAKQDAPDPERAGKYWAEEAANSAKFFVRWGYISDPEDPDAFAAALSHVHEMLLFDVGYEISDKQDRVVTLQLQTQHDISLMRQANQATKSFNQTIKAPIADENGLITPADIVTTIIGKLSTGGGTVGGCFLSDEQREVINQKFDLLGTRALPGPDDFDFLNNAEFDPDTESGRLMGYNTVFKFFNGLGVDVHINALGDPDPPPAPDRTISPAQVPELPPADVSENAFDQFLDQAQNTFNYGPLKVVTNAIDQELRWENDILVPGPIGSGILLNPFTALEPEPLVVTDPGFAPSLLAQPTPSEPLYSRYFTYESLQKCLDEDIVYIIPKERGPIDAQVDRRGDGVERLVPAYRMCVSDFVQVDIEEFAKDYRYKPSEHPEIKNVIDLHILAHQKQILGVNRDQEIEEKKQDIQDDIVTLRENPIKTLPPVPDKFDGSYISFTTPHKDTTLRKFLDRLNTTFFENTSDYIQYTHIPTANIDTEYRKDFENRFAGAKINWEKDTGVTLVGTIGFQNRLLGFLDEIKSFEIQIPDKPERIILSTGFSKNKTNIITDLSYRQSKNGWFFEFWQSPIIMQQVYSVAQRFENTEYRDAIWSFVELALDEAGEAAVVVNRPGEGASGGTYLAFPEYIGDEAFAAAARSLTDTDYVEDEAGGNLQRAKLIKQLVEDLNFIRENNLIETFFPYATKGGLGVEEGRAILGVENKKSITFNGYESAGVTQLVDPDKNVFSPAPLAPTQRFQSTVGIAPVTKSLGTGDALGTQISDTKRYRFIANSPIRNLSEGNEINTSDEDAYSSQLLAQKMRVLQAFKKRIMNVRLRTLGIPEMDIMSYEINQRRVGVIVSEPRVPGTYHWITGMYYPIDITHSINPQEGYTTEIELLVSDSNTQEEMLEVSFTFLEGDNA